MRSLPVVGRRRILVGRLLWTACAEIVSVACGQGLPLSPSNTPAAGTAEDLAYCAGQINALRRSVGLQPLQQSEALEAFAAVAARRDAQARIPHYHFTQTNGGGVSRAQTEILWWQGSSVRAVIQKGLAQMWAVGPSGEHYDILAGPFSEVGCGVFVSGSDITVTQDFR
jgi:uncharacterized protein YkwD